MPDPITPATCPKPVDMADVPFGGTKTPRQLDVLRAELKRLGYEVRETILHSDDYHAGHLGWQVDCRGPDAIVHTFKRVWLNEALEDAVQKLTPVAPKPPTNPITPAERADLRRLEAAATPGEWERFGYIKEPGLCRVRSKAREPDRIGRPIFLPVAECIHAPDAALIVAARNNLIRLLDALDAAEARFAESARSWADDHTHLQSLCRAAGIPEQQVSGDSYGVPGIGDLADLLAGKVAALRAEVERLTLAIRTHREQKADDRCIEDDDRLYAALGDGVQCDRRVGDKDAMLRNCQRFIERRCEGGGWPTYAELEAEVERLRAREAEMITGLTGHAAALLAKEPTI